MESNRIARFFKRKLLPSSLRSKLSFWYTYVFYQKWYGFYFLGMFNFIRYFRSPRIDKREKRVLGFEHFRNNSPALGSFLEFQMRLLCLAELHNVDVIDIALVYDFKKPFWDPKMSKWLNPSNFQLHLYEILPLLNMNPKLGSVFVFNSRDGFESFLHQNKSKYITCPSLFHYVNKSSAARGNYLFVRNFYLKKKYLPVFNFKPNISLWAKAFIKKYAGDNYAVTINLRMNSFVADRRNSDIPSWRHLLEYCSKKYPNVTFIILARKNEVPDDFREMKNVIFTKDYSTTMEQDMSLVKHTLFHMGVASGPSSFAYFSIDIPYCILRFDTPDKSYNYHWLKLGSSFPWQNKEFQRLHWTNETPELLVQEFEYLFRKVNKKNWRKNMEINESVLGILEWPYLVYDETKFSSEKA